MSSGNNQEPGNHRPACASCKHQRKKCPEGCVMAPHFPAQRMEDFAAVHRVFGIANVTKMIKDLSFAQQEEAIKSFKWEASLWNQDPVQGPYGFCKKLEEKLRLMEEQRKRKTHQRPNPIQPVTVMAQPPLVQWFDDGGNNFGLMGPSSDQYTSNPVHNYGGFMSESSGFSINRGSFQVVNPNLDQKQERECGGGDDGVPGFFHIETDYRSILPRTGGDRVGLGGDGPYAAPHPSLLQRQERETWRSVNNLRGHYY
ncbi:hypothetical protein U1Q18_009256 [Sarracenia purpurea var. burkii]